MVAATGNETTIDDFWWSRMVLTEGSRVRCKTRAVSPWAQCTCGCGISA